MTSEARLNLFGGRLQFSYEPGSAWLRICGYGASAKDTRCRHLLFSDRNLRGPVVKLGPFILRALKPTATHSDSAAWVMPENVVLDALRMRTRAYARPGDDLALQLVDVIDALPTCDACDSAIGTNLIWSEETGAVYGCDEHRSESAMDLRYAMALRRLLGRPATVEDA